MAMACSRDTSIDAEQFRTRFLQSRSGTERAQMAVDMTKTAHRISQQGIAARHPNYTPEQTQMAFVRLVLGDELFIAANPTEPLLAP